MWRFCCGKIIASFYTLSRREKVAKESRNCPSKPRTFFSNFSASNGAGVPRLRRRAQKVVKAKAAKALATEKNRQTMRQISAILKKPEADRSKDEVAVLKANAKLGREVRKRIKVRERTASRKLEVEDTAEQQTKKALRLAKAIQKAKNLVVYTGAGISTAADIPDYR